MKRLKYLLVLLLLIGFSSCKEEGPVHGDNGDIEIPAGEWKLLGLENETITSIAVHPRNPKIIYAGSASDFSAGKIGYLFKTTNFGQSWDTLIAGRAFSDIVIHPSNPEIVYTSPHHLIKSSNGGLTWQLITNGIRIDWETRVLSLALDPNNTNIMYAGTGGFFGGRIYKSTNGGESWEDISRDSLTEGVASLAIDPNNSNVLYAGTDWRGILWKTTNAGKTWFRTGLGETNSLIDAVAVSPFKSFNKNTVYASVRYAIGGRFRGLYKSIDGGIRWEKTQIPDSIGVSTILFSKSQPNIIYLATVYGCIMMNDRGNLYWYYLNEGLERFRFKSFNTINFIRNEIYLLAGRTEGIEKGGIYVRRIR